MNSYELSRKWFDWSFENPELISPNHSALYFFAIEHCNRLGWRKKFGFPTEMAKDAIGIKSYKTYINTLNDLVSWGFIEMVEKSKNQYSANIIALVEFTEAHTKALDKAMLKHVSKQDESTCQSIVSIDKHITNEHLNNINMVECNDVTIFKEINKPVFLKPDVLEIKQYCFSRGNNVDAETFFDFYESKGWLVGKSKMKDWRASVRTWEKSNINNKKQTQDEITKLANEIRNREN